VEDGLVKKFFRSEDSERTKKQKMTNNRTTRSVLLRGPLTVKAGYGVHARQVAKWLFKTAEEAAGTIEITTEPTPWGACHFLIHPELEDGLIGKIIQHAGLNQKNFYDVSIQIQLPNEWSPYVADFNVGVTAGVEADTCNPEWIKAINKMNLVIVPSEFTKQVFLDSGEVTTPIIVIPESYPELFDNADNDPVCQIPLALPIPENSFNFLAVGTVTGNDVNNDRKNLPYTIKWFCETFQGNPNVGLIVKSQGPADSQFDKRTVHGWFAGMLSEIRKGLPPDVAGPRVHLLHGQMSDSELYRLYTHPQIHAMVSFTHGEGWGLPLLEAASCGLPVIATQWSGHLDFLGKGKWLPVKKIMGKIPPSRVDGQIWMEGSSWAMPVEPEAKRRMADMVRFPATPKKWAAELKTEVRQKFNFKAVSQHYDKHLKSIVASGRS
jgi:glycosyltransferase involved in cell wall biosynthesis